jgi:hypothetical protein
MVFIKKQLLLTLLFLFIYGICPAQFLDSFDSNKIDGWFYFTGDGNATMNFIQKDGYARMLVDATKDKSNVWWALIKKDVTKYLDLNKLKDPAYELRVEAKVRISDAPRRVNFMVNTQRTTNYHIDLREFDIPDTSGWHIISMTTKNFDAVPGDTVYVQLCVTDFGLGEYYADLDYYRADIVNVKLAGPDKGEPLVYHPPIPDISTFSNHLLIAQDGLINSDFPDVNFGNWYVQESEGKARILTVNANQWAILRWDFEKYKNLKIDGAGILELVTQSVSLGGNYADAYGKDLGEEFGKVRVIEIMGGDPFWDQKKVTYNNFMMGYAYSDVFNTQMICDVELSKKQGDKNFITISRPVMQRLLDGTTKGILIRPLGALDASFYDSENLPDINGAKLHFTVKQ